MSTQVTPQQIIDKYLADQDKVRAIRKAAEVQVEQIEAFQKKREDYLLTLDDPSIFDFFTDLYLNGRDGKSATEAKKKELSFQMDAIEKWLLKMLDKLKSKGMKTEFGTVFPTRKEGVSVEDFDALLGFAVVRPAAEAILRFIAHSTGASIKEHDPKVLDELEAVLRSSAHFEFLNKAVNKTSVLEVMGEQDPKDHSRPNPPPPGVKYTAIRTVGVRKGKD